MEKQEQIKEIVERLKDLRNELENMKDSLISSEYQKVKQSINSSISFLNRASKQMSEAAPLEGQMNIFDFDWGNSDKEEDLEP